MGKYWGKSGERVILGGRERTTEPGLWSTPSTVSRKRKRCPNRVLVEPRMRLKHLFDSLSGGQFLQNRLDGNTRACDYRLAHHHTGIGNNHLSVIAHMSPCKPAYRAVGAQSSGPGVRELRSTDRRLTGHIHPGPPAPRCFRQSARDGKRQCSAGGRFVPPVLFVPRQSSSLAKST